MTRQELIKKLIRKERKTLSYDFAKVLSVVNAATPAEQASLVAAINTEDKILVADILLTLFDKTKDADALAILDSKIVNDKIDIDEVASVVGAIQ